MSSITVERVGSIGVRIEGVDAARFGGDPELPLQCLEVLEEHSVIVFPELFVTNRQHVEFSRRLGELEIARHPTVLGFPELVTVSRDESKVPIADYFAASFLWHTDGLLIGRPHRLSILRMVSNADDGGDTEFSSSYSAYEALTQSEKKLIADLRVVHSLETQLLQIHPDAGPDQVQGWRTKMPAQEHPLVWERKSGRRALLCGSSASHVVGMEPAAGRALLGKLLAEATSQEHVYRHRWSVGDVVMWDNPGCMHRVYPYDPASNREMARTTVLGTEVIE
jgi:alpha-ketoglutarate-dependent taurine dioxygenase